MVFSNFASLISPHIPSHLLLRWFQQIDIFLALEMSGGTAPLAATTPTTGAGGLHLLPRPRVSTCTPRSLCTCNSHSADAYLSLSVHLLVEPEIKLQIDNSQCWGAGVGQQACFHIVERPSWCMFLKATLTIAFKRKNTQTLHLAVQLPIIYMTHVTYHGSIVPKNWKLPTCPSVGNYYIKGLNPFWCIYTMEDQATV